MLRTSSIRRRQLLRSGRAARSQRLGTATVEFSLVAIPLFLIVMGSIEFGRGMMVVQAMEEAARCGCRTATLKGQTATTAQAEVQHLMTLSGVGSYTTVVIPSSVETAEQWSPVTVRVTASFDSFTWLPVPKFLAGMSYTASCVMPREAEPE
ncbi:MAG: pilus assembly protein [Pirellulaceae bacterium]|jgi:Flp pilus assembly protein TadG|nr:pilus assembly protein [Pirellulaceae bacterium]